MQGRVKLNGPTFRMFLHIDQHAYYIVVFIVKNAVFFGGEVLHANESECLLIHLQFPVTLNEIHILSNKYTSFYSYFQILTLSSSYPLIFSFSHILIFKFFPLPAIPVGQ